MFNQVKEIPNISPPCDITVVLTIDDRDESSAAIWRFINAEVRSWLSNLCVTTRSTVGNDRRSRWSISSNLEGHQRRSEIMANKLMRNNTTNSRWFIFNVRRASLNNNRNMRVTSVRNPVNMLKPRPACKTRKKHGKNYRKSIFPCLHNQQGQEENRDVTRSSITGISTGKVVNNGINHSHYTVNSAALHWIELMVLESKWWVCPVAALTTSGQGDFKDHPHM
jgi:hypothetical protein